MEKTELIEFLKSIIGSTVYIVNKNKALDEGQFALYMPQEMSLELFNSLKIGIKQYRYEFCGWRKCVFSDEEVYILNFKLDTK